LAKDSRIEFACFSFHTAEGDVTRQGTVEKKDNWVVICSRQPALTMAD